MEECVLLIKRGSSLVSVSAHQDKLGQWILRIPGYYGSLPGGFPTDVIQLPQSQFLHVFSITTVGIRTIPKIISNLKNVRELSLCSGDLEGFPSAVCHLHKLTCLNLGGNQNIKQLPKGVCCKLKRLRYLHISCCGLTCLPDDLDELDNLEILNLSDNHLSHLCDVFKNMVKLTTVYLSDNPFVCLEKEFPFDSLVNIETLHMVNTNMKTLPGSIGQLVKLRVMVLNDNKLERLPTEFCNLPSDATVRFYDNPLSFPPSSVCESDMSSIKSFFQSLEGGESKERTRRTKVIILGKSESGKSSLIKAIQLLLEGRVQDACVQQQDRTIGIDQHVVSLKDVDLVVLDSGGQRSYSPINQLFTSNSCLVIITADAQQYTDKADAQQYTVKDGAFKHLIQPYFQRVYDYVNTAVILPVVTKADLVPSEQCQRISTDLVLEGLKFQKKREELLNKYRQQNPGISTKRQKITFICKKLRDTPGTEYETDKQYSERCIPNIICTSAKVSLGVSDLIRYMNTLLKDRSLFPGLDMLLPSSWVKSEDHLDSLAKVRSPPISTLTATCQAVIPFGVSPHSVQGLLSYLHTVGSICHYDRHASLRQHVFLQPQFLINLLKAVYNHQLKSVLTIDSIALPAQDQVTKYELDNMLTNLCDNGVASIKLLQLIWSEYGFIEEHTNLMIKLLIAFHFAYVRCDDEQVIQKVHALVEGQSNDECDDLLGLLKEHNGELLLPWFFPDKKPEGLPILSPSDHSVSVCLTYSFSGSLPEGLFPRLSARCHRHSNSTQHWRNGVHMKYAGILSVIECNEARAEIVLSAKTMDSINAYARLWMVVWRLVVDIENEIQQAPGTIPLVQRYISDIPKGVQPSKKVGDRQTQITLCGTYPAFQMNKEGLFARQLEKHKTAVANAETSIQLPLNSLLSADNGNIVTEQDAKKIAFRIEDSKALSNLRFTLGVKKGATAGYDYAPEEAWDVINEWRELNSHACICVLRDALHEAKLSEVDDTVFGHIVDQTLTKAEKVSQMSSPGELDSQSKGSQIAGSKVFEAVLKHGVDKWYSIGLALELTTAQVIDCTFDKASSSSKLEAIIQKKVYECGVHQTEKSLLIACEKISEPIIGVVLAYIKSGSKEMSEQESPRFPFLENPGCPDSHMPLDEGVAADSLSDRTQDLSSTNRQCGTTALRLPSSAESAGQSSATPQGEVVDSQMDENEKGCVPVDSGDETGKVSKESSVSSKSLECKSTNKIITKGILICCSVFVCIIAMVVLWWI